MANDEEDAEDNRPSTSNPEKKHLRRKHAPNNKTEKEPQNPIASQLQETQTEHPNQQYTTTTQTDNKTMSELTKTLFCASPGKQPLLDNDLFNRLTTDEGNNIVYLHLLINLNFKP